MAKRKHYDDDRLIEALAAATESKAAIARRAGLSRTQLWRIAAGRQRRDLQPALQAAFARADGRLGNLAVANVKRLLARHAQVGLTGDNLTAHKCRAFIMDMVFDDPQNAPSA